MKRERDAFQRNNQKIMHKTTITKYNHLTLFIIIFRAYKLPSFLVLFVSTASNKLKLPPTISRFNITRTILLFCLAHSPFALVFLAGPKRCRPIRKYLDRLTTNESPPFLQATKVSGYTVRQTPREGAKTVHCLRFFHCVTLRIPRTCSGFFAQFSAFSYCIKQQFENQQYFVLELPAKFNFDNVYTTKILTVPNQLPGVKVLSNKE